MSITLSEAETILAAAKAEARSMGVTISATVVDARGDFKAGFRMDGVGWFTADVCRGKAFASANFGVPTTDLAELAGNPVFQSLVAMQGGRMVLGKGAVPIKKGDDVIGAIGVSGGTAQEDEDIAHCRGPGHLAPAHIKKTRKYRPKNGSIQTWTTARWLSTCTGRPAAR